MLKTTELPLEYSVYTILYMLIPAQCPLGEQCLMVADEAGLIHSVIVVDMIQIANSQLIASLNLPRVAMDPCPKSFWTNWLVNIDP